MGELSIGIEIGFQNFMSKELVDVAWGFWDEGQKFLGLLQKYWIIELDQA